MEIRFAAFTRLGVCLCVCVLRVYSRLAFWCVFWYGNCIRHVSELRSSWACDDGHYSGRTAAALPISSHHCEQVFSVSLQGEACRPHETVLPVHLKSPITSCCITKLFILMQIKCKFYDGGTLQ